MRPVLTSLSTDLRMEARFLRQCQMTSNYVVLVAWQPLLHKVQITMRISIESSSEGQRVWVGAESQPLVVPEDFGARVYPVDRPGIRAFFGAPFDLAKETDASGHHPRITRLASRRITKILKALPYLAACVRDLEPNKWDDATWCADAEARAYCLVELGRTTEAAAVMQEVLDERPTKGLDADESERWDLVQARVTRSLEDLAQPGKLERQLDEWAQHHLRRLGLDPLAGELGPLWL